jgi:hypothetical protein
MDISVPLVPDSGTASRRAWTCGYGNTSSSRPAPRPPRFPGGGPVPCAPARARRFRCRVAARPLLSLVMFVVVDLSYINTADQVPSNG